MKKIVVTTDFSENSKKGILFAIQLASQTDCELIFYNVVSIYMPTIWDNVYYNEFQTGELERSQSFLDLFIKAILVKGKFEIQNYKCVCEVGISASNQIIEYSKNIHADYICVSNTGAGKLIQMFGTVASELIAFCPIPVIIVPKKYKTQPVSTLFFASDFKDFNYELKKIEKFNVDLKTKLSVFHYDYNWFLNSNKSKFEKICNENKAEVIDFHLRKLDSGSPLILQIEKDILKTKPSMVVVFTKQNRNWFNRLFLSSLSAELAFDIKTPMLVFKKQK